MHLLPSQLQTTIASDSPTYYKLSFWQMKNVDTIKTIF